MQTPKTFFHVSVSVKAILQMPDICFLEDENNVPLKDAEARQLLKSMNANFIPGGNCPGFDYESGTCPGHTEEEFNNL
ncbi:MAG: hypothetical protein E6Q68_03270 [Polynucleobacter sp.]|nr:MAG: hypothetical protein E6Q68_03270 [Polynucleobacter sp.]